MTLLQIKGRLLTGEYLRMAQWLAAGLALYAVALITPIPQLQMALWKFGHITLGGWVGYWIARSLFGRIHDLSTPETIISRAMIVSAAMLAIALGL